jgi:hypothetical protein
MTSNEYIVRNCPCLFNSYYASGKTVRFECNDGNHDDKLCRDVTDCIIKQITELCNDEKEQETDPLNSSGISLAQKIVDLFDIEEINK